MSPVEPFSCVGRREYTLFITQVESNWAKGQVRDSLGTPQKYALELLDHSARLSKERGVPIGEDQIN